MREKTLLGIKITDLQSFSNTHFLTLNILSEKVCLSLGLLPFGTFSELSAPVMLELRILLALLTLLTLLTAEKLKPSASEDMMGGLGTPEW